MKKYYGLGMLLAVATTLFGGCEQKVIEDSVTLEVQAQETEQVKEKLVNSLGEEVKDIKVTYYDSNIFSALESDNPFFENRISKECVGLAKDIFKINNTDVEMNNASPYFTSLSVYISFSVIFSSLAIFQVLQSAFLIFP